MSRKLSIIVIVLSYLALATSVLADEAEDIKQVKEVIYRYEEGVFSGDADKIVSCFDPDFVSYTTSGDSLSLFMFRGDNPYIDPNNWYVGLIGSESVKQNAEQFKYYPDYLKKHPDYKHITKVSHVNVKDDRAIAVSKHLRRWTDQNARENVSVEHRTVWMLSKIRGEWKVTSYISPVTWVYFESKIRPPR